MANALATTQSPALIQWTPEQITTIKNTVAKEATDDELKMFLHLSQTYGLDPFAKEIWFIKMDRTPTIMTSRDGYLKIANSRPDFKGLVSDVVYEGDTFRKTPEGVDHQYAANKRGNIVGSYALVYRDGVKFPIYVFAPFRDYNSNRSIWKQFPHAMILKVAESMALKRAFSLSGLVSREELDMDPLNAEFAETSHPAKTSAPQKNEKVNDTPSAKTDAETRKKKIYNGYLKVCDHPEHTKNAILKVTGGRSSKEWTEEDMANLELDLKRRQEQERHEVPWPFEEPKSLREAVPEIDEELADKMGIGPDEEPPAPPKPFSEVERLRVEVAAAFGEGGLGFTVAESEAWIKEKCKVDGLKALKKEQLKKVLAHVRNEIKKKDALELKGVA